MRPRTTEKYPLSSLEPTRVDFDTAIECFQFNLAGKERAPQALPLAMYRAKISQALMRHSSHGLVDLGPRSTRVWKGVKARWWY